MSSTAKQMQAPTQKCLEALPSKRNLRLVKPRAASLPIGRTITPRALRDPLETPFKCYCGLCGNKIEGGHFVTEQRLSGPNLREQIWHYHEMCWKQFQRMRRFDGWTGLGRSSSDPKAQYRATGPAAKAACLSDCLQTFLG